VKRWVEGGHSRGETGGCGADELSKVDEHLLLRPERSLRAKISDPLEETGSLKGRRGAGEYNMFKGLWGQGAGEAGSVGIRVVPRVVCSKVGLAQAHQVDPTNDKLPESHDGVGKGGGGIGVICRDWGGSPVS